MVSKYTPIVDLEDSAHYPGRRTKFPTGHGGAGAELYYMSDYILTVGLEIHAELRTKTKMFCASKNDPDEERPNVNVCPVCMGHPGTLPTINLEAVRHVLRVGLAVGGTIGDFTEFDRKNYFYPDIPKGYQLSQYEYPLIRGGSLSGVAITRVHLEEDTATSQHVTDDDLPLTEGPQSNVKGQRSNVSLVDFNRAGVPLMELVTEPVIHSAKAAADFARELQLLLRYLGASDANMEKGEMRVEANISIHGAHNMEPGRLGTKVEVKNLNSFRAVERAIQFEYARQSSLLSRGEPVIQETRGWDETTGRTFSQRRKEEMHDYRYFPDPDCAKLSIADIPDFAAERLRRDLPRLPEHVRGEYRSLGLKAHDRETLVAGRSLSGLFDAAAERLASDEERLLLASYVTSDLMGLIKRAGADGDAMDFCFTPDALALLISMVVSGELSSRGAKDVLAVMYEKGGMPRDIAKSLDLIQKSDEKDLEAVVRAVIDANAKVAGDYKAGKIAALQFLVGQAMKATKGAANPNVLRDLFSKLLK